MVSTKDKSFAIETKAQGDRDHHLKYPVSGLIAILIIPSYVWQDYAM